MASNEDTQNQCESCDLVFEDDGLYQQHMQSSAHKAQVLCKQQSAMAEDSDSEDDDMTSSIICNICHKSFSGVTPYKQHLQSAQHLKQLQKEKLTDKLRKDPVKQKDIQHHRDHDSDTTVVPEPFASCSTCKKIFSGPQSYHQHMSSKKHARKLQEKKFLQDVKNPDKDIQDIIKSLPDGTDESVYHKLMSDLKEKLMLSPSATSDDAEEDTEDAYFCKDCNKVFSGVVPYVQHMISSTHTKKIKQNQLTKTLFEQESAEAMSSDTRREPHSPDACPRRVKFVEGVMHCDICFMAFSGPENVKAHLKSRGHQSKLAELKFRAELRKQNSSATSEVKEDNQPIITGSDESPLMSTTNTEVDKLTASSATEGTGAMPSELEYNTCSKDGPSESCLNNEDEISSGDDVPKKVARKKKSNLEKVTDTVKDIIENDI